MNLTPLELSLLSEPPDLAAELRQLLRQIPVGRVASFGDLAEALGDLQAARWVAMELQELDPDDFPVHRVMRRTGKILGTASLPRESRLDRLRREGVEIQDDAVDLNSFCWNGFAGARPLFALSALQRTLAAKVLLHPLGTVPECVAGVDVSYGPACWGVAAYAVVETATRQLLYHEIVTAEVRFPYIPGYLSFRELPLYLKLLDIVRDAGRLEPWLLVDGNGILHPRRAGIASLLGCVGSLNTVGVGKHRLFGKPAQDDQAVTPMLAEDGAVLGYRLRRDSKRSTLYVSPGFGVDPEGALRLTQFLWGKHRLPEPLFHADRLSRDAARRL